MHPATYQRVQHPCGNDDDIPRTGLDVNELARGALLAILPANSTPVERVPLVVNYNGVPDMGRMTV